MTLLDRFLKYVSFDTTSDPAGSACPSTERQKVFGAHLAEELRSLGLSDAVMDKNGYVFATIPANNGKDGPTLGFIAHMDTSSDCSGADIHPRVVRCDGGDIVLGEGRVLRAAEFPSLKRRAGEDLVVTDGTTLLGADDKAGIAAIVTMAETLINHPEYKHGKIRLGFTPDEEIGRGADRFDVAAFGADFAYTVDGGAENSIDFETFNAASADVVITGVGIHPGSAKNRMVNAALLALEFAAMLPACETPATTEGYEGFYHLHEMRGDVEHAELHYLIRDHDRARFEERKATVRKIAAYLNDKYQNAFALTITDSYYNMAEMVLPHRHLIDTARAAMQDLGMPPHTEPVRGGTDGSRLSFMGLPCPNLGTGSHNHHGRFEYASVQGMERVAALLTQIAVRYGRAE